MKIKLFLPVLFAAFAVMSLSCSDNEDLRFNNSSDPFSSVYEPGAPDSLVGTVISDSCIMLSWKSTSLREQGFRIFRKDGFYQGFKKIAEVPAKTTTFFDKFPLKREMTYYYQVASFTGDNRKSYSKEAVVSMYFHAPGIKPYSR